MPEAQLGRALATLFAELIDGSSERGGYVLNRRDPGLLRSLDRLSAKDASAVPHDGGASIAAHVDHVRYGLSLMNRWAAGENPWDDADWTESWRTVEVSDDEWEKLRWHLRDEAHRWLEGLGAPRDMEQIELNGMIGSIAHLAYHLGAMRQIDRNIRGPSAED